MSINLNDFLGQHLVLLWLILAAMLATLELLRRDWTFASLAVAAVVAVLAAVVLPHAWFVQLAVFVVAAIAGEVLLRRRRPPRSSETPAGDA
jgi:membrane protein implicated in regulation of membrane protease activity